MKLPVKLPACIEKGSLFARLGLLFSLLTLLEGFFLYMCVAAQPVLIAVMLALSVGFSALFLCLKQRKGCRVAARIGLLAPPIAAVLLIAVYCVVLLSYNYAISVVELFLLATILLESAVLFATPAFALVSIEGYRLDSILFRVMSVLNALLAAFTVFYVAPLQNEQHTYLLFTLIKTPIFDALFLVSAVATAIVSFDTLYKKREKK